MTPPIYIIGHTAYRRLALWKMAEIPSARRIAEMYGVSLATAKRDRALVLSGRT